MKKYLSFWALAILFLACASLLPAETFRFKFIEGDNYRINSLVTEKVYVNRSLSHSAEITNRITVRVTEVSPDGKTARHDTTFMTSERTSNRSFSWGREYESVFNRDAFGVYDIEDRYFMPVVRNVPVFPDRDVKPGETWKAEGREAHDFRDQFGLDTPFTVPFTATYTYVGPVEKDGKTLHHIRVEYTIFFDTPAAFRKNITNPQAEYPVATMGYSRQNLYWDNEAGMLPLYEEEFRIQMELRSGNTIEFRGEASAEVTETELMDRTKIVQDMNDEIARLGIKDTKASETERGIMLSLENIQFEADSARLLPSEKEKITRLAALLERYPDKELLITGHTALAGTASARKVLSEERAAAVARFLVEMGVRSEYHIYTQGLGAEAPIAPNDTEENRSRNRRVEITILER